MRLRCYLPSAGSVWFAAGCQGRQGCGHSAPIGIWAAIRFMSAEATVGGLERRLRCSRCGNRGRAAAVQRVLRHEHAADVAARGALDAGAAIAVARGPPRTLVRRTSGGSVESVMGLYTATGAR